MPRIPNTRPTSIYWLFDMRPETLIEWPNGRPFYCGKTVKSPGDRLTKHQATARECPHRKISNWLNACGTHVRVQVMEVVLPVDDWAARERHWIATLRLLFPGCANVNDGGQGAPGYVRSAATLAKFSASMKGKKCSAETRAKIGAGNRGRKHSLEHIAKLIAVRTGRKRSLETRARMSVAQKGRPGNKGLIHSAEARENMKIGALRREQRKREHAATV